MRRVCEGLVDGDDVLGEVLALGEDEGNALGRVVSAWPPTPWSARSRRSRPLARRRRTFALLLLLLLLRRLLLLRLLRLLRLLHRPRRRRWRRRSVPRGASPTADTAASHRVHRFAESLSPRPRWARTRAGTPAPPRGRRGPFPPLRSVSREGDAAIIITAIYIRLNENTGQPGAIPGIPSIIMSQELLPP